jgi:hypothetical protein
MKKITFLFFVLFFTSFSTIAQTTTVTKQNTLILTNHSYGLTNPLHNAGSPMTYNPSEISTNGAAFSINYTNQGGTSFDGYPSGTVGGFKSGGTYNSANVATSGMPVQIQNLGDDLRINWKTSQANANDSDDKWWATINVIFDGGTETSEPDSSTRDYDLVIQNVSYQQDSFADLINPGGRYWYFARNTDGSIKPYTVYLNGVAYSWAVRYKFFDYPSGHANEDKNDKVHIKFIPIDNSTPIPNLDHSLKQFINCTKNYISDLPLSSSELALANSKVALDNLWIKAISAGYEVYEGSSTLANDYFYTTIDNTVPNSISNLSANAQTGSVALNWNASTDVAFNTYTVYRSTNGGNYSAIISDLRTNSYTDTSIGTNLYTYYVTAEDRSFNESTQSNSVSADLSIPNTPSTVTATVLDCNSIDLTWSDNSDDEDSFSILQSVNGSSYSEVQTVTSNTESFSFTNLLESTSYAFKVNAVNTNGSSADANSNTSTTNACPVYYTLSTNATNGSITPNNSSFLENTNVTLTATADSGYEFSNWSGDASGSINPLTITMDQNKTITAIFTAISTSSTLTLTTIDDAHVRNGSYKNNNHSSYNNLQIYQTTTNSAKRYTYLKFDLNNINNITSATLRLNNTGSNGDVLLKKVSNDNWSEGSITWNNKPSLGSTINTYSFNGSGNHDLDVTSYITAEAQGDGIVSFVLKGSSTNYMSISSKEGGNSPELIIEYSNSSAKSSGKKSILRYSEAKYDNVISVFPNPVISMLNFKINNPDIINGKIEIFDITGRLVKKKRIIGSSMQIELDGTLGIYLVKILNRGSLTTKRIVKQ